ncbi:dienelactone hydrolase family protein [Telmatospirillum sp.]|uniref:alpha/beta hydrolase n=1 Tax=Telmatospirillum sp. TaxID=2079197 RepID=UPI002840D151|nr:dienelactone hydrolase family protein [Telmatospirillum sp.]MDR3437020.1 dienelactone hydrolase family protein [Telmatospirillum sp.]
MALPPLSGPSAGATSGKPAKQLVVFLHGVGSDGDDLIALAPYFAHWLPDADFLSPHAPQAFDMADVGRQWFSFQDRSPEAILAGTRGAAPGLNAYLDAELQARRLADRDLALVGFSQGTMMALHVALRRPAACAAVIGYSGLLASPDLLPVEMTARPPVLLVHGERDDVVPCAFMPLAEKALSLMGVAVDSLTCPNLGHSINDDGLMAGIRFAARAFGIGMPLAGKPDDRD